MTSRFAIAGGNAKTGLDTLGPSWPQNGAIIAAAKNLFPQHTRKTLARLLGISDGAAHKKLTGARAFSTAELAALIRSEHGLDFLVALMADAEPAWWRRAKAYFAAIDAQRMQRAARRKLREAIDADADLSTAIGRADALLVQDADFYGAHADAVRAAARVPDRTVVAGKGRKR